MNNKSADFPNNEAFDYSTISIHLPDNMQAVISIYKDLRTTLPDGHLILNMLFKNFCNAVLFLKDKEIPIRGKQYACWLKPFIDEPDKLHEYLYNMHSALQFPDGYSGERDQLFRGKMITFLK